MINKKILGAVIALVLVAAVCCACTMAAPAVDTSAPTVVRNSSVAVDPGAASTLQLSHAVLELPLDGSLGRLFPLYADAPLELQWATEDSSVAEVSAGIIIPAAPGTTVISCTDGVHTAKCKVIITSDANTDYTLRLPTQALSVLVGDTGRVEYTYTGPGAIAVFSNNPQVVQVENGCYKAVSPGTAVITITDGLKNYQCVVTVTAPTAD